MCSAHSLVSGNALAITASAELDDGLPGQAHEASKRCKQGQVLMMVLGRPAGPCDLCDLCRTCASTRAHLDHTASAAGQVVQVHGLYGVHHQGSGPQVLHVPQNVLHAKMTSSSLGDGSCTLEVLVTKRFQSKIGMLGSSLVMDQGVLHAESACTVAVPGPCLCCKGMSCWPHSPEC